MTGGRALHRGLRSGNSPVVRTAVDRLRLLRYGRRHVATPRPAHRKDNRAINGGRQPSDAALNVLQHWSSSLERIRGGIGPFPLWSAVNAGMALLHLPSLGGPSWQSLHHAARACVQGIRDANGADPLPNSSDLRLILLGIGLTTQPV